MVVDCLCDQADERNATVACFYFDFVVQKEQTLVSTMGALLKQVVGGLDEIPEEISRAYQKQKKAIGRRGPQLSDIIKMLETTSSKERTFICIDALDECAPEHRAKLLDSLNQILRKSPGTRVFVTGRSHIRPEIRRRLAGRVMTLSISSKREDIIRYLHTRLEEDTNPDAMDSGLEADILRRIPEDVSEMYVEVTIRGKPPQTCTDRYISRFLLVSLNIDAILQETTIHRRRQKLSSMTDGLGLGDAYGATLSRIKGQGGEKSRLGMAALVWISYAERPLKPSELCHALAVEIGSPNLNTDNIPSISTLLACCQGLIVVDKEGSTVRLIHFTLQEYLRTHPEHFGTAHSAIAETCLSYLNSHQVKSFSTNPSPDLLDTPFLEYSSLYWGVHAKKDFSDRAKLLALKLFDDYSNHISAKILTKAHRMYWYAVDSDKICLFSGLHCASFFGILEIVAYFVEIEGCDINQMDFTGNTPLHWAALNGHEGAVKILLGRDGIDPDKPDNSGRIPLHHAARRGYEEVVKIFLERDGVNPDKPDSDDRTPLWGAAQNGHEGVVKILLEQDGVNPDHPDKYSQTPLCSAARNGHEGVVEMLLERGGVNPDKPSISGRTPLLDAIEGGYEGVVKILLGRGGANPNKPDMFGKTSLHYAAMCGREGVMKILLGRDDVNPDKPESLGRTPLHYAAVYGQEGVMKILLERDGINPGNPDIHGEIPLHYAARGGHEGMVALLLGRDDVDPDKPGNYGHTPLWSAAFGGHEGVVKILLGRDDVDPDKPDRYGQTPLWAAARYGRDGVVKILLGREDVNPHKPDNNGQTPLFYTTKFGHQEVIALLQPPESSQPA